MKFYYLITAFAVAICFVACTNPQLYDERLTEQEKALIPFKGKEKLVFTSNRGNTEIFSGNGYRDSLFWNERNNICDIYAYNSRKIHFTAHPLSFRRILYTIHSNDYYLFVSVSWDGKYYGISWSLRDLLEEKNYALENLEVNGRTYHKVYKGNSSENKYTLYYAKGYGVIRMVHNADTTVWDLKEVIP